MELRVGCGPRVAEQQRKRKVVAAECGAPARSRVFDSAGFEEPVQLHTRPTAQLDIRYQPALLRDVNRQDAHWRHRGDYFRFLGRWRPGGIDTRPIFERDAIYGDRKSAV